MPDTADGPSAMRTGDTGTRGHGRMHFFDAELRRQSRGPDDRVRMSD